MDLAVRVGEEGGAVPGIGRGPCHEGVQDAGWQTTE